MDNRTSAERFWSKVDVRDEDDCWLWTASTTSTGYASFQHEGKYIPGHRYSYAEAKGAIPDGLVVDHNCHNLDLACPGGPCKHRRCVNPSHLRAVPQGINLVSSTLTVNHASTTATHCPSGHAYAGDNLGFDGTDRYCRTCKREQWRASDRRRAAAKRERYALLRAAGLSAKEARSASKVKVARYGNSQDPSAVA